MNYHETPIDVRWGDLDMLGHVNNVAYLTYYEQARVDTIYHIGSLSGEAGVGCVVVQANVSYKVSVEYPATLKVVTSIQKIGNTSMIFHHTLRDRDGDTVYSEADVTVVWVDRKQGGGPVSVPDFVRAWAQGQPGS